MAHARIPLAVGALAVLALAACHRNPPPLQPLALSDGGPSPLLTAPPADGLPPAPRAPIRRVSDARYAYAYPERAWAVSDVLYDSPPDWAFDYDGAEPWVWRTDDGYWRVVEWVPGGERVYYYAPGWDRPYFIDDPDYGYAYDRGALVAVYDRTGRFVDPGLAAQRADYAGRYLVRAADLFQAAQTARRAPISRADWSLRRDGVTAQRTRWTEAAAHEPALAAMRDANRDAEREHWAAERGRRATYVAQVERRAGDEASARRAQAVAESARVEQQGRRNGLFGGRPQLDAIGGPPPRPPLFGFGRGRDAERPQHAAVQGQPRQESHHAEAFSPAQPARPAERAIAPGPVARSADQAGRDVAFHDRRERPVELAQPQAVPSHAERPHADRARLVQGQPQAAQVFRQPLDRPRHVEPPHVREVHAGPPPGQGPLQAQAAVAPPSHGNPHADNHGGGGPPGQPRDPSKHGEHKRD